MKDRCFRPTDKFYHAYGGRGITVCERWMDFANFFADMGEPPQGHSLDRIDNNGNYEPSNCRWATAHEQANNKQNTKYLAIDGETRSVGDWSRIGGIPHQRILQRLSKGWDPKQAVFKPMKADHRRTS